VGIKETEKEEDCKRQKQKTPVDGRLNSNCRIIAKFMCTSLAVP
jgi:hypothetical protein